MKEFYFSVAQKNMSQFKTVLDFHTCMCYKDAKSIVFTTFQNFKRKLMYETFLPEFYYFFLCECKKG